MILVDKEIKNRSKEIFKENYDSRYVQPISYDIHINEILEKETNQKTYDLEPHEVIMVRCKEVISVPNDLIVRIENKNSLIRLGLSIAAPIYNPGHETPIYLRVENVSGRIIELKEDMAIAQMIFEKLSSEPEVPYNIKSDASYNNENDYRGLGKYKDVLERQAKKAQKMKDDLESKESSIYANILTMMGIFVSIFSIITVNFASINNQNFNKNYILTINVSLGIVITLFLGLILIFLNKKENKWFNFGYLVILGILVFLLFVII